MNVDDLAHDLFDRVTVGAAVLEDLRRPAIQPVSQFLDGLHAAGLQICRATRGGCEGRLKDWVRSAMPAVTSLRRCARGDSPSFLACWCPPIEPLNLPREDEDPRLMIHCISMK